MDYVMRSDRIINASAVVQDVNTGAVLAMVSFPSYDPNKFENSTLPNNIEYINNILHAKDKPLFNRVISGLYSPGSTIKPVHATAALAEGIITPNKQIFSAGYIEIPNPYNPKHPTRFLDWKPQGWVDIYSALARSSNVYFYTVGGGFEDIKGLGINRLRKYWKFFKLDKSTGIDFPGETYGLLPSPEEKKRTTGSIWRIGDTYNISIGQGDLRITPIELLDAIIAISNKGIVFSPHIAIDRKKSVLMDLSQFEPEFKDVRKGMEDVVKKPYGTAHLLSSLTLKVAAKTGSTQTNNNTKTNALFVGYAPTDKPQIAILILVEDAKEGSLNAVPIAKDVFQWYYENRLK